MTDYAEAQPESDAPYPSPEQWAEWRKNGHQCQTCKTRVWPAPAPAASAGDGSKPHVSDSDRDRLLAIVNEMEDGRPFDLEWVICIREIALGGQTFESWKESHAARAVRVVP